MTRHTKPTERFACILVLLSLLPLAALARAGTTSTSYKTTSTVYNGDANLSLYLVQSDQSFGSTAGSTVYSSADANVVDVVSSSQWQLDLTKQTVRQVYLDFSSLTAVGGSAAWPSSSLPSGYYSAALISSCYDATGKTVSWLSISGSNNNCTLRIWVAGTDGFDYALQLGNTGRGAPPTGTAQVTCNALATDGSGCNDWTLAPYLAGASTDTVADLTRLGSGGHPQSTLLGSYSGDTFRLHITRP
jgi:hypothetical protein